MTASNDDLDLRNYVGPVRASALHVQHLARGMEAALPSDADPHERTAMTEVLTAADAVQEGLNDRDRFSAGRVRPALQLFGTAWVAFFEMLCALARFSSEMSPRGPRAQALLTSLFPDGIAFVKQDAGAAWAAGQRRLDRIETEGLTLGVGELVGSDVLEAARRTTMALREASGAGPTPREHASVIADTVSRFSQSLASYCRLLVAKVHESDPASVDRFRRAVMPLDQYRASRRGHEDDDDEVIDDPVVTDPAAPPIAPGMPGAPPFMT